MTSIVVRAADSILGQFADKIAAIGDRHAHVAFARALNHEGDKGRTHVKRALVAQTGIKYGMINRGMKTLRASYSRLEYSLLQSGGETNLALFGARQGARGVSAAPWNVRRVFRSGDGARASFISPRSGKVLIRSTSASYPLEALFGPNLAREIVKDESRQNWEVVPISLAARIDHELARLI
jgi:hypothetical protein